MDVLMIEGYISLAVVLGLLLVKVFAFANAMMFPGEAYAAADKLTKPAWAAILGLGVATHVIFLGAGPISLLNIVFTIAAFVYLADVRPALASVTRR
ncbi:DUF2516 family protein [Nocardioides sp.]|uniref:DUF2516 family protein n=1 Tax=Nocardioides sp. TaxID=35761 RepID=UPI0027348D04|nr:DUF2516 family protein [Nocardioides sp.]MDP3894422.1 DUF2516 family protein [Nocardioides sp.]